MTERPVAAHELRALANSFRTMVGRLVQGSPPGHRFIKGAIYGLGAAAVAMDVLSVVGKTDDVKIDLPDPDEIATPPDIQERYDRLAAEQEAAVVVIEGLLWTIEELQRVHRENLPTGDAFERDIYFKKEDARRVLATARGQRQEPVEDHTEEARRRV